MSTPTQNPRARVTAQLVGIVLVVAFVFVLSDVNILTWLGMGAFVVVATMNLWLDPWRARRRASQKDLASQITQHG